MQGMYDIMWGTTDLWRVTIAIDISANISGREGVEILEGILKLNKLGAVHI